MFLFPQSIRSAVVTSQALRAFNIRQGVLPDSDVDVMSFREAFYLATQVTQKSRHYVAFTTVERQSISNVPRAVKHTVDLVCKKCFVLLYWHGEAEAMSISISLAVFSFFFSLLKHAGRRRVPGPG